MFRLYVVCFSFMVLAGCHHANKPQSCEPETAREAQVIMTRGTWEQESMATLDMAEFARRH